MNYRIEVETPAERDIRKLPREVRRDIYGIHLPRILADPEVVGERLRGDMAALWRGRASIVAARLLENDFAVIWQGVGLTTLGTGQSIVFSIR